MRTSDVLRKREIQFGGVFLSREAFLVLEPICRICSIVGLFPFKFINLGKRYRLEISPLLLILSYALAVTYAVLSSEHVLMIRQSIAFSEDIYTTCIDLVKNIMILMLALYSMVHTPGRARFVKKFSEMCCKIDQAVPLTNYRQHRRYCLKIIMAGFLTTFPIIFFNMAVISTIDPRSVFKSIAFDVLNLIFLCHGYLLMHLVFLIRIRLMALNASLLVETERLKSISEMVWVVPNRSDKSAVDNILNLLSYYRLIQKLALTYNNRFSVDMLLIVVTSVVSLLLIPTRPLEQDTLLIFSRSIFEFLVHVGRLLIVVESCYRCSREAQRTKTIILDLLTLDVDDSTREAFLDFSKQIPTYEITFSACGLFEVNRKLFLSIAKAFTMYLVALFQFNN